MPLKTISYNTYSICRMPVSHQDTHLQLDASGDNPDIVKADESTKNCSATTSSISQSGNRISFKYVCTDDNAVFPPSICNDTTSGRATTENLVSSKDNSLGELCEEKDTNHLVGSVAALDICDNNKIDDGKVTSSKSGEKCEQHESRLTFLHHNKVLKVPCSSKDLMAKTADKAKKENESYQRMKCGDACSLELQLACRNSTNSSAVPARNYSCSCNSKNNSLEVKDCVNKSGYSNTKGISSPALIMPHNSNAFPFNCSQDVTKPDVFGHKCKTDPQEHVLLSSGIDTDQMKINCVNTPNEILVHRAITQFPSNKPETIKINVRSEKVEAEVCPTESTDGLQAYANSTEVSVTESNGSTKNIPIERNVRFSAIMPKFNFDDSKIEFRNNHFLSTSQQNTPLISAGISTASKSLAPDVVTSGSFEPLSSKFLNPLSLPSSGIFNCNTNKSEIVSSSDSSTLEPHLLQSQLNSSVSQIKKFSLPPRSTNMNNPFQCVTDLSFPLITEQNSVFGESLSSVFSGFKFCTLSSPISSSTISKPIGTASSASESSFVFGTSFESGMPCTESVMLGSSTAGSAGNACLKPWPELNSDSNVMTAAGENKGSSEFKSGLTECSTSTSSVVSFGTQCFPALTTQLSSSIPLSSTVSTSPLWSGIFKLPKLESTTSSSNNVTTGTDPFGPNFQFGSKTRSSLIKETEMSRFSPSCSTPGFGSDFKFPKFEPVKDTSVGENTFSKVFQVKSSEQSRTSSADNSTLFTFGSAAMKQNDGASAFNSGISWEPITTTAFINFNSNNRFSFGIPSPATSSSVFNFESSDKKPKDKSPLHFQLRSRVSAQNRSRVHRTSTNTQMPFRVVTEVDTHVHNGNMRTITLRHQHFTAMPEYSKLSFEELRLQYAKYNLNKQTEPEFKAIKVKKVKKVQTTESKLEAGNYLADMWKILECPVCLEIVTSPVLQCERGHHVCNQCWKQVISCPLCKCYRSMTRNYVAEAMVEKLPLPCKYRVDGCAKTMCQEDKITHEKICLFRIYTCLVDDCTQAHNFKDLLAHLKKSHSHLISGNYICIPKGQKFSHTLSKHSFQSLVHAFNIPGWGVFFLRHEGSGQIVRLWMQAMNTGTMDAEFMYTIEVADVQELRSVSYKGPVVPLHTIVDEQHLDCLAVTDLLLDTLKNNLGFNIKVSIWQNES